MKKHKPLLSKQAISHVIMCRECQKLGMAYFKVKLKEITKESDFKTLMKIIEQHEKKCK